MTQHFIFCWYIDLYLQNISHTKGNLILIPFYQFPRIYLKVCYFVSHDSYKYATENIQVHRQVLVCMKDMMYKKIAVNCVISTNPLLHSSRNYTKESTFLSNYL